MKERKVLFSKQKTKEKEITRKKENGKQTDNEE